jgi:hypothetical protein
MGLYEILAEVKDTPGKFFIFNVGGGDGHYVDMLHNELNAITLKDALTLPEVMDRLTGRTWQTVEETITTENGDAIMQSVRTHHPEEEELPAPEEFPEESEEEDDSPPESDEISVVDDVDDIHADLYEEGAMIDLPADDEPNSETETWSAPDSDIDHETVDNVTSEPLDDSSAEEPNPSQA